MAIVNFAGRSPALDSGGYQSLIVHWNERVASLATGQIHVRFVPQHPSVGRPLEDREAALGWWSVRRQAMTLLTDVRDDLAEQNCLQAEIPQIRQDPNAAPEDRRGLSSIHAISRAWPLVAR